jgi:hypothetical protein
MYFHRTDDSLLSDPFLLTIYTHLYKKQYHEIICAVQELVFGLAAEVLGSVLG